MRWPWKSDTGVKTPYLLRIVLAFCAIAVLGLLVWNIIEDHIRWFTPFVAIAVTDYESPTIPANSLAYEDIFRFDYFWGDGASKRKDIAFTGNPEDRKRRSDNYKSSLREQMNGLAHPVGGPGKDLIIFYISAHGVVDGDGCSCLLLNDADPHDSKAWLRVEDLLETLSDESLVPSETSSGEPTKKVLFLDCNRFLSDPRIGVLYNGFAAGLQTALNSSEASNLVIINSAQPGQIAWSAPELGGRYALKRGGTPFGYFLARGLSGAANTDGNSNEITLRELGDYLEAGVSNWVQEHRAAQQHLMYVTPDSMGDSQDWKDWRVAYRDPDFSLEEHEVDRAGSTDVPDAGTGDPKAPPKDSSPEPNYVQVRRPTIEDRWQRYDELPVDAATRAPLRLAAVQFWLSRLEQLLLAGEAYEKEFGDAAKTSEDLLDEFDDSSGVRGNGDLTVSLGQPLVTEFHETKLYGLWDGLAQADGIEPIPDKDPRLPSDFILWLWLCEQAARSDAGQDVAEDWLWLCEPSSGSKATIGQVDEVLRVLDAYRDTDQAEVQDESVIEERPYEERRVGHLEVAFLRMLSKFLDREAAGDRIGHAILSRALAERAANSGDVRCHYWIQDFVNAGDQKRRSAEDLLFVGSATALDGAATVWKQLFGDQSEYRAALSRYELLARAYRTRDQVWTQLPVLRQWLVTRHAMKMSVNRVGGTAEDLDVLVDLTQETHKLAALLDQPFEINANGESLSKYVQEIQSSLVVVTERFAQLMGTYSDKWNSYLDINNQTCRDWGVLLSLPVVGRDPKTGETLGVGGDQRNRLRSKYLSNLFDEAAEGTSDPESTDAVPREIENDSLVGKPDAAQPSLLDLLAKREMCPVPRLIEIATSNIQRDTVLEIETFEGNAHDDENEKILFLAKQGRHVREFLSRVGNGIDVLVEGSRDEHVDYHDGAGSRMSRRVRQDLSQADRVLRITAPLLDSEFRLTERENPTEQLQRLDRHFLLLWQSYRVLQDFWGPIDDGNASASSEMFFDQASRHYEEVATDLYHSTYHSALRYEGEDLKELRKRLRELAATPSVLVPVAEGPSLDQDEEHATYMLGVSNAADLPRGTATVFIHQNGSMPFSSEVAISTATLETVRRFGVDVGSEMQTGLVECNVLAEEASADRELTAQSFFRGHVKDRSLRAVQPGVLGDTLVYERKRLPPPKVAVHGSSEKTVAIVFILDCSKSMDNPTTDQGTRLKMVWAALRPTLDALANRPAETGRSYRIALRLYGHRVYWEDESDPGNLNLEASPYFRGQLEQWEKKYPGQLRPESLTPHSLKELERKWGGYAETSGFPQGDVFPIGDVEKVKFEHEEADGFCRLTPAMLSELGKTLEPLRPWGLTPLYFSISQALERDLAEIQGDSVAKQVIVLTDGLDWSQLQTTPGLTIPDNEIPREVRDKGLNYVRTLCRNIDARIDVVGIVENDPDLQSIAKSTGGAYVTVNTADKLMDSLKAALPECRFRIVDHTGEHENLGAIGETEVLEHADGYWPPTASESKHTITVEGFDDEIKHTLYLEGGEHIDLHVDEENLRLIYPEFPPMDRERPVRLTCLDPRFQVNALTPPEREGNELTFRFSVQRCDDGFSNPTRRPLVAVAAITPLERDSSASQHVPIYVTDFDIEAGQPVPVLRFRVRDWPTWSNDASVQLWFHPREAGELVPDEVIEFDTAKREPASVRLSIPGIERVDLAAEVYGVAGGAVIVTERYSDNLDGPSPVIVKPGERAVPQIIQRTYGADLQHRFDYDRLPTKVTIRIWTPESLKKNCRSTCNAITLTVPRD